MTISQIRKEQLKPDIVKTLDKVDVLEKKIIELEEEIAKLKKDKKPKKDK
jgi:uncharacterized small protein (DUF1192 family)